MASAADLPSRTALGGAWQLRWASGVVAGQGLVMLAYVVLDIVLAARDADANWGAVASLATILGVWGAGLLLAARGLRRGRRMAFTPAVFTQLMFGFLAVDFLPAAGAAAKVVWSLILVTSAAALVLLLSRPVRAAVTAPR